MAYDLSWLEEAGLDVKTGIDYTGSEEKYISAIRRFYTNFKKYSDKAAGFLATGDLENYMITVHSLKSNARMIGAADLSKGFEALEAAARDKNRETIDEKNDEVMSLYKTLTDSLKPVEKLEDVKDADEISPETAIETANELLNALDGYDDELSKDLAVKLTGYPFRITQRDKLKEAIGFIDDFMYEEATGLIKEIIPSIE